MDRLIAVFCIAIRSFCDWFELDFLVKGNPAIFWDCLIQIEFGQGWADFARHQ